MSDYNKGSGVVAFGEIRNLGGLRALMTLADYPILLSFAKEKEYPVEVGVIICDKPYRPQWPTNKETVH